MSTNNIQVLKFGGTSVAGRGQWEFIAELCQQRQEQGRQILLVCSALAGCTDTLEICIKAARENDQAQVAEQLDIFYKRHQSLATELGLEFSTQLDSAITNLQALLDSELNPAEQAQVLASGEYLSTLLGHAWLIEQGIQAEWKDATSLLSCPNTEDWRGWLQVQAVAEPTDGLFSAQTELIITQGFIAANSAGEICLLGRGGSDISAILLAAELGLKKVEIYSDVPGLFSADPRACPAARLLLEVDYAEALEMAAAGAAVIHPQAIGTAEDHQLEISMRQSGDLEGPGTRVHAADKASLTGTAIKAICLRENMLALLLENRDQNRQVGFLAAVFSVFADHGLAIEQVATSETTTTISIHAGENRMDTVALEQLEKALQPLCKYTLLPAATAITIVGRGLRTRLESILAALGNFNNRRLFMTSVSANDIACTLLVPEADSHNYLVSLHQQLIESNVANFGSSWQELQSPVGTTKLPDPKAATAFYFSSCEFEPSSGVARLGFRFDNGPELIETIQFDGVHSELAGLPLQAFNNSLHLLHLIVGISYYKAGVPARLVIETLAEDAELAEFLEHLYLHGLAEFAYCNDLDLKSKLNFEFTGSASLGACQLQAGSAHDLVALGGGKDSLVAVEMLKSMGRRPSTVAVGNSALIAATAKLTGQPFIRIGREMAVELQRMNAAGAWNGHVPVTAINSAILVCQAILSGFDNVIFANEASASSPNLYAEDGSEVNHQYSKGLDFESRFQNILQSKVAKRPVYFSLLRPWRELAIVQKFSQLPQYFSSFSSCNRNFHLQGSRIVGRWCGDCPKCRFASLMLALYLPRTKVSTIIGRDLWADAGQIEGFANLCGFNGHKPFECVGEVEESRVAVMQLLDDVTYADSPVLEALRAYLEPVRDSLPTLAELLQPSSQHLLPEEFQHVID